MNTEEKGSGFIYPMFGAVSDVQVWDRVLSDDSLAQWVSCQNQTQGNILSWTRARLEVTDLSVVDTDMREGFIHLKIIKSENSSEDMEQFEKSSTQSFDLFFCETSNEPF